MHQILVVEDVLGRAVIDDLAGIENNGTVRDFERRNGVLLDEPYEGLAPVVRQDIAKALNEVRSAGITSVIVEQNAVAALKLSDRAVILDTGEVVYDGSAQHVLDNEDLMHKYLAI